MLGGLVLSGSCVLTVVVRSSVHSERVCSAGQSDASSASSSLAENVLGEGGWLSVGQGERAGTSSGVMGVRLGVHSPLVTALLSPLASSVTDEDRAEEEVVLS